MDDDKAERNLKKLREILDKSLPKKEETGIHIGKVDMDMNQLLDMLSQTINSKSSSKPNAIPPEERLEMLRDFVSKDVPSFTVGTRVELNKWGRIRYNLRNRADIIISKVFDVNGVFFDNDGTVIHGEVAAFDKEGTVIVSHTVDFRYFQQVQGGGGYEEKIKANNS